jgi:serine-type D-Ala-D-Ala carboxypeptidase/endopeptidase (penicillin-binding protein 4)
VLSVLLLLSAGGYAAYDAGWLDRYLGETGTIAPAAVPPPEGVRLPAAAAPLPVLDTASSSAPPPRALARRLRDNLRDDDLGRHVGVLVEPLTGSGELLRVGGGDRFIPASSLKLLTSAAALEQLGPGHRFTTSVVRAGRRGVVLVGGGDPLLTQREAPDDDAYPEPATFRELARGTARRLQRDGVRRVRLGYDATLFTGPAVNPTWKPSYVPDGVVSPISALWVDEGREDPGLAARSADPAAAAAAAFAEELERAGIAVRGRPAARRAPEGAPTLARVRSAPLGQIVQHVIEISDNEAAEVLLRHVGLAAGGRGTSAAGAAAVEATLRDLGVGMAGVRVLDGSGLSRGNRLTLDALVDTMQLAASAREPDLRRVVTGLPVAGFSGSLAYRFVSEGADGRGMVRAKTGTLSGVHALAGVTVDRDGTPLAFVAIADRVRLIDTLDARAALDGLTADIAECC